MANIRACNPTARTEPTLCIGMRSDPTSLLIIREINSFSHGAVFFIAVVSPSRRRVAHAKRAGLIEGLADGPRWSVIYDTTLEAAPTNLGATTPGPGQADGPHRQQSGWAGVVGAHKVWNVVAELRIANCVLLPLYIPPNWRAPS